MFIEISETPEEAIGYWQNRDQSMDCRCMWNEEGGRQEEGEELVVILGFTTTKTREVGGVVSSSLSTRLKGSSKKKALYSLCI